MTLESIAELLKPYTEQPLDLSVHAQLAIYLQVILKWNTRINLTAIRTPEEIVRRHFGESLFAGTHLGTCPTLLDFGSGAGFPGIPIQLLRPDVAVTLAESQGKKAAFLQEAVRSLGLTTEVWAGRVEAMPPDRRFHTVALRAVDNMEAALREAARRASQRVLILGTRTSGAQFRQATTEPFSEARQLPLPMTADGTLWEFSKSELPQPATG